MFARIKKSGQYQHLQIVENSKVGGKVRQRVLSTVGRLDHLQAKGSVETLIRSLARFSEQALLVLSDKFVVDAHAVTSGTGPDFRATLEEPWFAINFPGVSCRPEVCI